MLEGYDATGKIGDQYHGFADHDSYATKTEYLYGDNSGRLKHLRTLRGPQAGCGGPSSCENPYLQEEDYFFEQSGDIQKIIHHRLGRTYSYHYDGLHRLVGESRVGRMRIVAAVNDHRSIKRYLGGVGIPSKIPEIKPARPPPQTEFEYEYDDLEYAQR